MRQEVEKHLRQVRETGEQIEAVRGILDTVDWVSLKVDAID